MILGNPVNPVTNPMSTPAPLHPGNSQPLRAILWGGIACGVLDIAAAMISSRIVGGAPPQRILQSIAGGLLGPSSFQGGWSTAALGLALHFVISFGAAAGYLALSRKFPGLNRHAVLSGFGYGFVFYWFMNGVVLPLSALHARFPSEISVRTVRGIVIHLVCVGLPIALAVRYGAGRGAQPMRAPKGAACECRRDRKD
jgi:uncharacterized membrane protein YagU involved in acid resistance